MKRYSSIFIILGLLAVLSVDAFAQTRRKRKPRAVPPPVSTQQIIEQSQPEVIGQTDTRQEEVPVTTGNETQTAPETTTDGDGFQNKIDQFNTRIKEMSSRVSSLESSRRGDLDEKQRKLLLNLEILSRAEQRAEGLREKLFTLTEKENAIKAELEQVEYDSQEDVVNRNLAITGSMRPEELRAQRLRSLQNKKTNLNALLQQIQTNKAGLEENVVKADMLVEKLRQKFETDIDNVLNDLDQK
jgi:DNA repair exonuclease SbcCD ATPase subunit